MTAEAFHYYKLKKLIAAYAVAKAFSGRRPSTTVIPIPIPIPLPIQQNEIIKVPSQSAGKKYVTAFEEGPSDGMAHSLNGGSMYKFTTIKGSRNLNRLNGNGGLIAIQDDGGHSIDELGPSVPNIIYAGGGGSSFGYGGYRDFSNGYEVDYPQQFAPSNMYRDRRIRGYRAPYRPRGRRIRSHRYYDFPDDSEHYWRSQRRRRCRSRSKCGQRMISEEGPVPVGEVYGKRY